MPVKILIARELVKDGDMCALGVLGSAKGIDMSAVDPDDMETVAGKFDVAECLSRQIVPRENR